MMHLSRQFQSMLVFQVLLLTLFSVSPQTRAQSRESLQLSVDAYTRALNKLAPGQETIAVGDMIFTAAEIEEFRDTLKARLDSKITGLGNFDFSNSKQWTGGVVPYAYDKSMPEAKKAVFEAALREWQKVASINFVPRSSQANYIAVTFTGFAPDATMSSQVGMKGGAQTLNVANWGNKIDCAHELGHALGMIHEQMRADRDTYVSIFKTNVSLTGDDYTVNFALARSSVANGAYDYDSLMHYGRSAFAINKSFPTILAKSPNDKWSDGYGPEEIGQKDHLSAGDKAAMASVYGSPLTIEGIVADAAGKPLAGVQVTLSGGAAYRGDNPISTDASGHYAFTGIPKNSGTYTVTPSQTGTSFTEGSKQAVITTAALQNVNFAAVDSAPPDLVIDIPTVSGLYTAAPRASGTASDAVGLKEIRVALARSSDLVWWNWTDGTWGTTTFDWAKNVRIASGKTSWAADLPSLSVGGYQVHVQSVDLSDNASPWRFRHFFVDPEPPIVTVTEPVPGTVIPELLHIRGIANDGNGTGIKDGRVYFTLYQNGDFWTGFNWKKNTSAQDPEVLLWADVVNGEWIYNTVPGGDHDHGGGESPDERSGQYALSVFARDNAGNLCVPKAGVNNVQFTVDKTPPSIGITIPSDGATLTNLTTITGTATDTKSLESVRFYLYSFVNGQFWDGTAWGGGGSAILPVSIDTQKGLWTSTANLPSVYSRNPATRLANGAYNIIAFAVDSAGNQTRSDVVIHIEYFPQAIYTAGSYNDQDPNNNNDNWDNPANWDGGFVPGPGDLAVISSGNPRFTGTKTVQALKIAGGELHGDQVIIPDGGTFIWSGGTLSSDVTIQPGGQLNLTGNTSKVLSSGRRLVNNGDCTIDGEGSQIHGSGGSKFLNSGAMTISGDVNFVYYNNGISPIGSFENQGTITKQGSGILRFTGDYGGWILTNGAALVIDEGAIFANNQTYLGGTISGNGKLVGENGTLHLDSITVLNGGAVELNSGTLTGTGTFTGNGTFIWSGGTLDGDITIDSETHGLLKGSNRTLASGARLQNRGTTSWEAGQINASGKSRLENSGRLDINATVSAVYYNNGIYPRGEFDNGGLVTVNNGAIVLFRDDYGGWHFNNHGQTRVTNGKLLLSGGGTNSNAVYEVQSGSIELSAGEPYFFSGNITVRGRGRMRVTGGQLNGDAAIFNIAEETTYEHNSGTAQGTFNFSGPGTFIWSGGTLNAATDWKQGLRVQISGDTDKNLEGGKILQEGTLVWTDAGRIRATGAAELRNTGSFEIRNDSGFIYYNNGIYPVGSFVNSGTIRKTSGSGATRFFDDYGGWRFSNTGTIDIQTGTIDLLNTSTLDAGSRLTGSGALRVVAGTTTISGTNTVENGTLAFVSGALNSVEGWINGSGTFSWSGGAFSGTLNVAATNFAIVGTADKVLSTQSTIRNFGSASWRDSGALRFTGASFFENAGRFDLQDDTALFYYNNGVYPRGGFINAGSFIKSAGTNVARFPDDYGGALFDNSGTVSVRSGALHLGGGGSWNKASVDVASGAELRLFSGRFTLTNLNSFTGRTLVTSGEVSFLDSTNTVSAGSALTIAGATVSGNGTVRGPGALEWTAGTVAGNVTIASDSSLALAGDAEKLLVSGTINNYGHGSWSGAGGFKAEGGALFNNYGEFVLLSDSAFTYYNNGIYPRGRFHNAGLLRKTGSTGASTFSEDYGGWDFSNVGVLQIDSGVLSLRTGNSFTNAVIKGAGRVRLDAAGLTLSGTTKLDGGTLELANGYVDGSSTLDGSGTFLWTGGELRGAQTVSANGQMLIAGTGDKNLAGSSTLTNNGHLAWTGSGVIRGVGQSHLVNNGMLEIENDSAFVYYNNGIYPIAALENNGTIVKSGGTGKTVFSLDYGGWRFVNPGTLKVHTGTFDVGANYEPAPSTKTVFRLSGFEPGAGYGAISFPTTANLSGIIQIELANTFVPSTNGTFVLATYPSPSGEFTSPVLPVPLAGKAWKLNYAPSKLELSLENIAVAQNGSTSFQAGKFQLALSGPPGKYALLQRTTNLINWVNIETNQPFNGTFNFSDANATNASKFYRTVIVP